MGQSLLPSGVIVIGAGCPRNGGDNPQSNCPAVVMVIGGSCPDG